VNKVVTNVRDCTFATREGGAFSSRVSPSTRRNGRTVEHWLNGERGCVRAMLQATGKCKGTLAGHTDSVECVAFAPPSPGLQLAATGSMDGTVIIWDTNTMQQRCSLPHGDGDGVVRLAFHPTSPGVLYTCAPSLPHTRTIPTLTESSGRSDKSEARLPVCLRERRGWSCAGMQRVPGRQAARVGRTLGAVHAHAGRPRGGAAGRGRATRRTACGHRRRRPHRPAVLRAGVM